MPDEKLPAYLKNLSMVFAHRVRAYGNTPDGVLWKSRDGQMLRFEVLSGLLDSAPLSNPVSIADFGCGYGAFYDFLGTVTPLPPISCYTGYDICPDMISRARQRISDPRANFVLSGHLRYPADYTFVSGTYNMHIDVDPVIWTDHIKTSLAQLWENTRHGLAFNMLDINHPRRLRGLYYANREEFLEYCSGLSPNVTLIDDYPLDEWSLFIRR